MSDVGIAEEKVVEATGHGRAQWFTRLDGLDAGDHTSRVKALQAAHPDLSGWWAQMLTVEYERMRGLRQVGQTCAGDYQVSCSKTLAGDPEAAYEAIQGIIPGADWSEGAVWNINGIDVEVRRADPGQMLRWFWFDDDGKSTVEVHFQDKGDRTTVTLRHHQLANAEAREAYREKWKAALARL